MAHDPGYLVTNESEYWRWVGRFAQHWAKGTRPTLRERAQDLVSSIYPETPLLERCEDFLQAAFNQGRAGDSLSLDVLDFGRALPESRWRDVNTVATFCSIAWRQWQLGRSELVRSLLREHRDKRERRRHGLEG